MTIDQAYSFQPEAKDADDDDLTFAIDNAPDWLSFNTSDGTVSGTPQTGDEGTYDNITISVSDGELSDSLTFAIIVEQNSTGSVTLSWQPPTRNSDGTRLTDLAGYKLYYGTEPGTYPNEIDVANPGLATYVISNLADGTWYFVATAYDADGNESIFSNQAVKRIQSRRSRD